MTKNVPCDALITEVCIIAEIFCKKKSSGPLRGAGGESSLEPLSQEPPTLLLGARTPPPPLLPQANVPSP